MTFVIHTATSGGFRLNQKVTEPLISVKPSRSNVEILTFIDVLLSLNLLQVSGGYRTTRFIYPQVHIGSDILDQGVTR